jgi:type IV pilus assembly protein PilF
MKRLAIFLAVWGMAGCASQPGDGQTSSHAQAVAKAHTDLAAAYYERLQYSIALEEVGKALNADSGYAPAYDVRGLVNMALHEDQQAEKDFQHSLELDGNDPQAQNNYGWFLCQRGRERESVKYFMNALKVPLYTTPEQAYLNAGVCSGKIGETKNAEEFLKKALALRPNMPDALLALADLDFSIGDYAGAKSYFMRFLKSSESLLSAENLWLGWRIEHELGDKDAAESYALQLRKRFPDSRETQLLLHEQ